MTYSEVLRRVYDILRMPENEARRVGYATSIPREMNEGFFRIAHSVLPNLREYTVHITRDKLPARIDMPPDFISFADEQDAYLNGYNFIMTEFIGRSGIIVTGEEAPVTDDLLKYTFFYNALYPKVINDGKQFEVYTFKSGDDIEVNQDNYYKEYFSTDSSQANASYDIPEVAGNIVPHYIVGQILSLDDKVRSIEELNTFETLLASIDVRRNERQRQYHSVRGWY